MVTGVGLNAPASCAAIRCAIDSFSETHFMDRGGEWIIGSEVRLEIPWRGFHKLIHMIVPAIRECLDQAGGIASEHIPLILCLAEQNRPGRAKELDDDRLFEEIQKEIGTRFHPLSDVIAAGRVGGVHALMQARKMIYEEGVPFCLVAGIDSLLSAATVAAFQARDRLKTKSNSNGFIPGEAGAAVLVGPPSGSDDLLCLGIGEGYEKSTIESEEPLRGDGLVQAFQAALSDAGCELTEMDFRLTDLNGEQYWFKEASLAVQRLLRVRKERFQIWHPSDCVGEIGSAIVPCVLGVALAAMRKDYAPGSGALAHFGSDGSERFALVLKAGGEDL
jgi:3-oxoacyl-[acyl-carrier-protein] synthase I